MELRGNFLPQFHVPEAQFACSPSTKRDSQLVVGMFTREPFPAQFYRLKNLEVHCNNEQNIQHLALSKNKSPNPPDLSFDRLQLTDQECTGLQRRSFGRFVAREAILDEEYWTAAWLRAEAHWESLSYMRHADSFKRKYAEEEFYALKRRCFGQEGNSLNCFCIVAVKDLGANLRLVKEPFMHYIRYQKRSILMKDDKNIRRTVLNSIVGTLDISIKQFMQRETHPGGKKKLSAVLASQDPFGTHKYAYIANVCVAKFARRQGIATNMLYLATDVSAMAGMKQLFVHVNADNKPAQDLYKKAGFQAVEEASSPMSKDQRILMSMEL